MKRTFCVLMAALMLLTVFAGCKKDEEAVLTPTATQAPTETGEQVFTKNGLKINLPAGFEDHTGKPVAEGCTFLYSGAHNGVKGVEDKKDALPESVTDLKSYAAYQAEKHGVTAQQKDNFWTITYLDNTYQDEETYVCVFYEGDSCYWTVSAYCRSDVYETYQEAMWGYVTAATFE